MAYKRNTNINVNVTFRIPCDKQKYFFLRFEGISNVPRIVREKIRKRRRIDIQ